MKLDEIGAGWGAFWNILADTLVVFQEDGNSERGFTVAEDSFSGCAPFFAVLSSQYATEPASATSSISDSSVPVSFHWMGLCFCGMKWMCSAQKKKRKSDKLRNRIQEPVI